jgi:hypothetical protein
MVLVMVEQIVEEEWRPAPNYVGIYQVSNKGRVRRVLCGKSTRYGRIMNPMVNSNGYHRVGLTKGGKSRQVYIHDLVLGAFFGAKPDGWYANHIDGVKTNNDLENLEYVSPSDNSLHAYRMGLSVRRNIKFSEEDAIFIRLSKGKFSGAELAERFGVHRASIYRIWQGRRWKDIA